MKAPASTPIALAPDEALRVLFVFAEARGSKPLGARRERRELLRLFEKEIYPQRRVVAHFLTHGVTRERLGAQIQENRGYHVVRWSGHGHMNLLELCRPGGAEDRHFGQELLDLFNDAGSLLPRLFFLSACYAVRITRARPNLRQREALVSVMEAFGPDLSVDVAPAPETASSAIVSAGTAGQAPRGSNRERRPRLLLLWFSSPQEALSDAGGGALILTFLASTPCK